MLGQLWKNDYPYRSRAYLQKGTGQTISISHNVANGELAPTDDEAESYAVSLDGADSTEGRTEIKGILHDKGLTADWT